MLLSQFKQNLNSISEINFVQTNGQPVPKHFHITEAGLTTKHFIDCGGTIRKEQYLNFQVWVANDTKHRLEPQKLEQIIAKAAPLLGNSDLEVEVEYQGETIGRYGLDFDGISFLLKPKKTDCLALENCGIPAPKTMSTLANLLPTGSCKPGSGCC